LLKPLKTLVRGRQEAQLLLGCPIRKNNPNPNPNIAGPERVRQHLDARHGGRTGDNLAKTGTSLYQCIRVGATVAVLLARHSLSA